MTITSEITELEISARVLREDCFRIKHERDIAVQERDGAKAEHARICAR